MPITRDDSLRGSDAEATATRMTSRAPPQNCGGSRRPGAGPVTPWNADEPPSPPGTAHDQRIPAQAASSRWVPHPPGAAESPLITTGHRPQVPRRLPATPEPFGTPPDPLPGSNAPEAPAETSPPRSAAATHPLGRPLPGDLPARPSHGSRPIGRSWPPVPLPRPGRTGETTPPRLFHPTRPARALAPDAEAPDPGPAAPLSHPAARPLAGATPTWRSRSSLPPRSPSRTPAPDSPPQWRIGSQRSAEQRCPPGRVN